jgi:hypothetical protein
MRTGNVFHLVHRFGDREDQISASFGFVLQVNRSVLIALLHRLRIPIETVPRSELRDIEVQTQVSYTRAEDSQSRIDLEIRLPGRFIVFLESKLGNTALGVDQLKKYTSVLRTVGAAYDHVRLVLVTQFNRSKEAELWRKRLTVRTGLRPGEFEYLRWEDIRSLVQQAKTGSATALINDLFLRYVGDMMSDKKIMKDQIVGKVPEVMIVATDPDWWEFALKRKVAVQANSTPDARYVAFYRVKPEAAITHVAEVESTETNVLSRDLFRKAPVLWKRAKQRGWFDRPQKVYRLGEIVPLAFPIRRRGRAAIQVKAFKTMSQLLKARSLEDLFRSRS